MTVAAALELLIALINQASTISTAIKDAQAAGKTVLSADQWATILAADTSARSALITALAGK